LPAAAGSFCLMLIPPLLPADCRLRAADSQLPATAGCWLPAAGY